MTQQLIRDGEQKPSWAMLPARLGGPGPVPTRSPTIGLEVFKVLLLCVTVVSSIALYWSRLHTVDLTAMNGYGLISVLPVSSLVGLALLTVSFFGTLSLRRRVLWLLGTQLVLLVLMLHGITMLLESQPRFAISWIHAGFVEFIDRTGTTAPSLDARWSWPGFFALAAFWVGSGDRSNLLPILTTMPVVNNLLYVAALALLACSIRMSWQARWFAAWLFCLLNWVGQDYFSPQAWTFLLYLLFVGLLVGWFRQQPTVIPKVVSRAAGGAPQPWRRLYPTASSPGELPARRAGLVERVVLLATILGLFTVATISHQLTPFAMVVTTMALVAARRCTLKGLPVLLIVIIAAWISFMTQSYWTGHLDELVSSVGDVRGTLSSSVVERASAGDLGHQWVVNARVLTAVTVFSVAGVGLVRRRMAGLDDRVLWVLLLVPFSLIALQSYGGEIALRVYLFSLAPACALVALAFFPHPSTRPTLLARSVAAVCALILTYSFILTRYGNEPFERTPEGAVAAVEAVYQRTDDRIDLVYLTDTPGPDDTPFMPLGYRDVERVSWASMQAPFDPLDVAAVVGELRDRGPGSYLITTRSQDAYLVFGEGYPASWTKRFHRAMMADPSVRLIVYNADAAVYSADWPRGSQAEPFTPPQTGIEVRRTPWTPVGVGFLVMLVAVLGARDAWGAILVSDERKRLRPLTFASVPLLVGFTLVVVERFVLLAS